MSYQWLLFDADGTLFDYYQAEDAALAQNFTLHHLGFQSNYRLRYREINHQFWLRLAVCPSPTKSKIWQN